MIPPVLETEDIQIRALGDVSQFTRSLGRFLNFIGFLSLLALLTISKDTFLRIKVVLPESAQHNIINIVIILLFALAWLVITFISNFRTDVDISKQKQLDEKANAVQLNALLAFPLLGSEGVFWHLEEEPKINALRHKVILQSSSVVGPSRLIELTLGQHEIRSGHSASSKTTLIAFHSRKVTAMYFPLFSAFIALMALITIPA